MVFIFLFCYRDIFIKMEYNTRQIEREFQHFFTVNFPRVKNFAQMLLKSECDAEDVAQEVFCKLWMQPEVWRDVQKPDGYIFMMTKNLILNIFKHQRIEQEYQENVIDQKLLCEIVESEQLDDIYYKEMQMIVRLVLERMPERRRAIFELSRFEGLSNKEIAAKFNISVRTVEHQIYQALIELKKILLFFVFYGFLYK